MAAGYCYGCFPEFCSNACNNKTAPLCLSVFPLSVDASDYELEYLLCVWSVQNNEEQKGNGLKMTSKLILTGGEFDA